MRYHFFTAVLFSLFLYITFVSKAHGATISEVNIELTGNIIDTSCIISGSSEKTVELGKWTTKQLPTAGSTTQAMPFTLQLTSCPSGSAAIIFTGTPDNANPELLALNGSSTAQNVAIEIRDKDRSRLPLQQQSQEVSIDSNGDVALLFYANYIATGSGVTAGSANADVTFSITYN